MPIYEYQCLEHGVFEKLVSRGDCDDRKPCPKCRKQSERVLSTTAPPKFKGSGFYETDYKKKK